METRFPDRSNQVSSTSEPVLPVRYASTAFGPRDDNEAKKLAPNDVPNVSAWSESGVAWPPFSRRVLTMSTPATAPVPTTSSQ